MTIHLSPQDITILSLLQLDERLTTQQIAARLNMSQSPCWRRINRLQEAGFISGQPTILNRQKLAMEVVVFATVNLSSQGRSNLERFEQQVQAFAEVVECYTMAGSWDYMLKIVTRNIHHYEQFVRNQLTTLADIGEVHSHIAVTEIKNTTALPLATQL